METGSWWLVPVKCAECGNEFMRKVKAQRYCDEHRSLGGAPIRAVEVGMDERIDRALEHLAGAMQAALRGNGSVDMRITSEDARDVRRAAEIIRLQRLAFSAGESRG